MTLAGRYWQARGRRPAPAAGAPHAADDRLATARACCGIALPHVDAWNTWYTDYGNTAEGFAALNERISAAARDAGRDPAEVERSACVHVVLDRAVGERPIEVPPLEGPPEQIAARLRELAEAGADEAILVVTRSPSARSGSSRGVRSGLVGPDAALAVALLLLALALARR